MSACGYGPVLQILQNGFGQGLFLVQTVLFQNITARVSSDNPRLKAFCRVAPSVLFKVRAIVAARVLLFASFFNVRTSFAVQVRLRLFMLWPPRFSQTLYLLLLKKLDLDQIAFLITPSFSIVDGWLRRQVRRKRLPAARPRSV